MGLSKKKNERAGGGGVESLRERGGREWKVRGRGGGGRGELEGICCTGKNNYSGV